MPKSDTLYDRSVPTSVFSLDPLTVLTEPYIPERCQKIKRQGRDALSHSRVEESTLLCRENASLASSSQQASYGSNGIYTCFGFPELHEFRGS